MTEEIVQWARQLAAQIPTHGKSHNTEPQASTS